MRGRVRKILFIRNILFIISVLFTLFIIINKLNNFTDSDMSGLLSAVEKAEGCFYKNKDFKACSIGSPFVYIINKKGIIKFKSKGEVLYMYPVIKGGKILKWDMYKEGIVKISDKDCDLEGIKNKKCDYL